MKCDLLRWYINYGYIIISLGNLNELASSFLYEPKRATNLIKERSSHFKTSIDSSYSALSIPTLAIVAHAAS